MAGGGCADVQICECADGILGGKNVLSYLQNCVTTQKNHGSHYNIKISITCGSCQSSSLSYDFFAAKKNRRRRGGRRENEKLPKSRLVVTFIKAAA